MDALIASESAGELLLRALAGYGIAGNPLPDAAPENHVFRQMLRTAEDERLLGALAESVAAGAFPLEQDQIDVLSEHHADWLTHALRIERLLVHVSDAFETAGIDFRVLKGVALAHLVYPDPSWRVYADLDLLVRSDQFDAAVRVASTELGGVQEIPELRPGFDSEFGKEALVRVGRIELDLHRTFVTGPFGLTIDLDELWRDATSFVVGESKVLALGPTGLFMHACYNTALGDLPMRRGSVRDLLVCCAHLDTNMDAVAATAGAWRATAVVQRAAELVIDSVDLAADHPLRELARLSVPRREAWLLRSYLTPSRSYSRQLASLAVISGVRPRLRYVRALVAPSGEYLRSRGWTERSHLRRAARRLRGARRG